MYRVDKRSYKRGEQIDAAKQYMTRIDHRGVLLECAIEKARPADKPSRKDALFLFEQYCCALKFWSIQQGSIFYEVEAIGPTRHRGDMCITERMYASSGDLEASAKQYWAGLSTSTPCWEWLVPCATVTRVVSDCELERQAVFHWIQGRHPLDYGLPDVQRLMCECYQRPPRASRFSYGCRGSVC